MNLAEIRKKAIETRKPDDSESSNPQIEAEIGEIDDISAVNDMTGMVTSEFPLEEDYPEMALTESADDDLSESGVDEGEYVLTKGRTEISMDVPPLPEETDDEEPVELLVEPLPESVSPEFEMASLPDVSPKVVATVRHPAYDPIATLLAGRESATCGEETLVEEEQIHLSGDVQEYLCFKVAHEEYALSIMDIKEIIKPREVTEVPRMPKFVSGVISLRGVIIPIMDMRLRLSLPIGEPTGRERVLVLRTSVGYCGVIVDEVIQVVRIHNSAIEGPPTILDGIDREFVMGLGRFDNRMLILLNLDSILNLDIR